MMVNSHRLLPLELHSYLPRQDVRSPLVEAQLADIDIEPKYVGDLHHRIEKLGGLNEVLCSPPHYRDCAASSRESHVLSDGHNLLPVLVCLHGVASPENLDLREVDPRS